MEVDETSCDSGLIGSAIRESVVPYAPLRDSLCQRLAGLYYDAIHNGGAFFIYVTLTHHDLMMGENLT